MGRGVHPRPFSSALLYAAGSCQLCPVRRGTFTCTSCGPSPLRAPATALCITAYSAWISPPSTDCMRIPWKLAKLSTTEGAALWYRQGTDSAYWLSSISMIYGRRCCAAILIALQKPLVEVAPSPAWANPTAPLYSSSPMLSTWYCTACAHPTAGVNCAPTSPDAGSTVTPPGCLWLNTTPISRPPDTPSSLCILLANASNGLRPTPNISGRER